MSEDLDRSRDGASAVPQSISGPGQGFSAMQTGARINGYVIQSILGAGGFGITYLAEHEGLGKLFAIKEYFPRDFGFRDGTTVRASTSSEGTYRWGLDRFLLEAQALARFRHPAIVDVANVFEANGTAYMVLAYEPGHDLRTWRQELGRSPTQGEIDRLLLPLLDALEIIHDANLLHRDVSPDNILVRADGSPVLIDFGSARDAVLGRGRAMSAVIKHGYSPAEQYTSEPGRQGPWTDVYALAATLYFLVTGHRPMDATARFVQEDFVPAAEAARGHYSAEFLEAIDVGMALRPENRPQSIGVWRNVLFPRHPDLASPLPAADAARVALPVRPGAARPRSQPPRSISRPQSEPPKPPEPNIWPVEDDFRPSQPKPPENFWETGLGRAVGFGAGGIAAGAIAGALGSIIVASIVRADCVADSCIGPYVPAGTVVGAVAGLLIGLLLSRSPPIPRFDSDEER